MFSCGPTANESESKAFDYLKRRLQSVTGDGEFILLTNLSFSVTHRLQSDEVDIVVIGPPGVRVIEVKHWTLGRNVRSSLPSSVSTWVSISVSGGSDTQVSSR